MFGFEPATPAAKGLVSRNQFWSVSRMSSIEDQGECAS